MGDIRRNRKKFARPRKAYDIKRIQEENEIVKKFGLKNKREIWKAEMAIKIVRDNAKKIITADEEVKEKFIGKLKAEGFSVNTIGEILALNKEDWLKRRLQTVLVSKQIVLNPKEARQLIVHKHVLVNGKKVNVPSYRVGLDEEDKIKVLRKTAEMKKGKQAEKIEAESSEEIGEEAQ